MLVQVNNSVYPFDPGDLVAISASERDRPVLAIYIGIFDGIPWGYIIGRGIVGLSFYTMKLFSKASTAIT
jgi:hypothetical protein